jgi:hypothetical protein
MPIPIDDAAFEYLLARAGLTLTDAEKLELKAFCDGIAAMAERVRKPRGRMAEPALTYGFAEDDLR